MKGNFISAAEVAEKWRVSLRYVQNLCKEGRIEGAEKFGTVWVIPSEAERPKDLRVKSGKYKEWREKRVNSNEF